MSDQIKTQENISQENISQENVTKEKVKEKAKKSRNFTFTMYKVNEDKSDILEELVKNEFAKTIFFTHELGAEGDNPHIQGFVACRTPNTITTVKNKLNNLFTKNFDITPNPHIEIAQGTAYQNFVYITKELKTNPALKHQLFGEKVLPPGKKRDDSKFESYVELLEQGKIKLKDIEKQDLAHFVRHEAYYLSVYSKILKRAKKPPSFVAWFCGSTATGKSTTAAKIAEILDFEIYDAGAENNFFNYYSGEDLSVWDDFRMGNITYATLLKITDRKGTTINIKGGKVWFNPKIQIFTSPDGLDTVRTQEMKNNDSKRLDNKFDQLKRRISYYIKFETTKKNCIPTKENIEENQEQVIKHFLGTYKQFLIDEGYEEFIDLIPNLNKYEAIPVKKLINCDPECKVYFTQNPKSENDFNKEIILDIADIANN